MSLQEGFRFPLEEDDAIFTESSVSSSALELSLLKIIRNDVYTTFVEYFNSHFVVEYNSLNITNPSEARVYLTSQIDILAASSAFYKSARISAFIETVSAKLSNAEYKGGFELSITDILVDEYSSHAKQKRGFHAFTSWDSELLDSFVSEGCRAPTTSLSEQAQAYAIASSNRMSESEFSCGQEIIQLSGHAVMQTVIYG